MSKQKKRFNRYIRTNVKMRFEDLFGHIPRQKSVWQHILETEPLPYKGTPEITMEDIKEWKKQLDAAGLPPCEIIQINQPLVWIN